MTSLPVSLQTAIYDIIQRTNDGGGSIRAVLLSTTEGVPLGRCCCYYDSDNNQNNNNPSGLSNNTTTTTSTTATSSTSMGSIHRYPPTAIASNSTDEDVLSSIESIWAPASKQFPSLGLHKLKQVTTMYDHGTVIQLYQTPMVIAILCGPQSNIGAVRSTAIPLLKQVLEPLAKELVNMLQVDPELTPYSQATTYYQ